MLECAPRQERKLELKYCERCGGLWLRPQGSVHPYCGDCTVQLRELLPSGQSGTVSRYRRRRARASAGISRAAQTWDNPESLRPEVLVIAQPECAGGASCA